MNADLDSVVFGSSNQTVGMVEMQHYTEVYRDEGITADHTSPTGLTCSTA